ncbi:DUF1634 domain-containing protein [Paraburkholderia sp. RL17-337-BIB-A]|uniref:DUF1634 domain-containing protein n=1 Tax=Paraburkholderia sp. RL17-337-BIB-A TaxID=3031636 RepID=UPI0038BA33DB
MSRIASAGAQLERWLARLLHHGTWVATITIASGLAIGLLSHFKNALPGPRTHPEWLSTPTGMHIVTAGIALFILLPIMRLILMLGMFLHQRDYRFSAITALVLAIVAAGLLVGAA